jgi:curved DNA-binding protein CbpA
MLGARTQDATPSAADEVFVSALANGKVYITYGSIEPEVRVPACIAIKANYDKKADKAADDLLSNRIDRKAYDKLGDLRQPGDDAYKKCFVQRAPQEPSFAEATRQAQALLAEAMGK